MLHPIEWRNASPLWEEALKDKSDRRFKEPAILRFASDTFMEDLTVLLSRNPLTLKDLVAHPETWKDEGAGWALEEDDSTDNSLKLYQPAHGRFYLVAASLVCHTPGLPDRFVDTANEERVSFVLRRQVTNGNGTADSNQSNRFTEYGWVTNGEGKGWKGIIPDEVLGVLDNEERLPLFPINFPCPKQNGRKRRLWVGFIPVASRETYQAASELSPLTVPGDDLQKDPLADPRLAQFEANVVEAMVELRETLTNTPNAISPEQARQVFAFILLDLAEFLREHLSEVWNSVLENRWLGSDNNEKSVFDRLHGTAFHAGKQWDDALHDIWNERDNILSDKVEGLITDNLIKDDIKNLINSNLDILDTHYQRSNSFNSLVKNALGTYTRLKEAKDPVDVPKFAPGDGASYVLRCVYERPHCKGIHPPVVSEPSRPFQLASFFDPEAPARPVRITMPIDTSISGLRKFPKNVSFLISNKLRQQIERIRGVKLEDLDGGDIGIEPSFDLGVICSLSIPIITICALILLMIIVQLLNIVFWWLPFFKICFPLNLKK